MDVQEAYPGREVTWVPKTPREERHLAQYAVWAIERLDPPLKDRMKGERSARLYPVANGARVPYVTVWVTLSRITAR